MVVIPVLLLARPGASTMEAARSAASACRAMPAMGTTVPMWMNAWKTDATPWLPAPIPLGPSPAIASLDITGTDSSAHLYRKTPPQDRSRVDTSSVMPRLSAPILVTGPTSPSAMSRATSCHCSVTAAPASAGAWTLMAMKSQAPGLLLAPLHLTADYQSPPRGPRPSVNVGEKTCWSTMVAPPGMTNMCPSAMTWAASPPCSATGRVTSAGVWTEMAERCRAPAPSLAPPLHAYPRSLHPRSGPHPGLT